MIQWLKTGYLSREQGFHSQPPQGGTQLFTIPLPGIRYPLPSPNPSKLYPFLQRHQTHVVYRYRRIPVSCETGTWNRTEQSWSFPPASPSSRERWEDPQWAELGWVCLLPSFTLFTYPDCVPRSWGCRGTLPTGHYKPLWVTSLVGTVA